MRHSAFSTYSSDFPLRSRSPADMKHEADLAEHLPLGPVPVVLTKDPRDVGVGVGVAAVQEVPVIEVERGLVGALRCIRRLQDLPPGASACVVHVTCMHPISRIAAFQ